MSSRHRPVDSNLNTPSEKESDDINNETETITQSPQGDTSVEQNTNPTETTQQNPLQIQEHSFSNIFTKQVQNPPATKNATIIL